MRHLLVFIILSLSVVYGFEGPEFMLIGRDYLDEITLNDTISFNYKPRAFEFKLADANLYGIRKLDWHYGQLKINTAIGKFRASLTNYGIPDLYVRQKYEMSYRRHIWSTLYVGAGFFRETYNFSGFYSRENNDFISLNSTYSLNKIGIFIGASELPTKRDIKLDSPNPELLGAIKWRAGKSMTLHGIYFKDDINHSRFEIGQQLTLAEPISIGAGFITGPQVYYLGTIISYKGFAFEYVFYDVTQLPGCWSLALIFR